MSQSGTRPGAGREVDAVTHWGGAPRRGVGTGAPKALSIAVIGTWSANGEHGVLGLYRYCLS